MDSFRFVATPAANLFFDRLLLDRDFDAINQKGTSHEVPFCYAVALKQCDDLVGEQKIECDHSDGKEREEDRAEPVDEVSIRIHEV